MAFEEYLDLIDNAKRSETPYVLYTLDGIGKERQGEKSHEFVNKSLELLLEMKNEFIALEEQTGNRILVRDNKIQFAKNKKDLVCYDGAFACYHNPNFTSGDLLSFYFYSKNMSLDLFKKVFEKCAKKIDNKFTYHVAKIGYQTNDYYFANNLLWVGYAQQYLNFNKNERICDVGLLNKGIER